MAILDLYQSMLDGKYDALNHLAAGISNENNIVDQEVARIFKKNPS